MYRKYMVYVDDDYSAIKLPVIAENEEEAKNKIDKDYNYNCPERIVAIQDVTDEYPISYDDIWDCLQQSRFNTFEKGFIISALEIIGIFENSNEE